MTLAEFKAWFEGFTEDMDDAPNEKQWERIKARIKDIDGVAVTREVYVDRHWWPTRYSPPWNNGVVYGHGGIASNAASAVSAGVNLVATDMTTLGKADYMDTKAA